MLSKCTISADFKANRPKPLKKKICVSGNYVSPQKFCTRRLGEISGIFRSVDFEFVRINHCKINHYQDTRKEKLHSNYALLVRAIILGTKKGSLGCSNFNN